MGTACRSPRPASTEIPRGYAMTCVMPCRSGQAAAGSALPQYRHFAAVTGTPSDWQLGQVLVRTGPANTATPRRYMYAR